MSRRPAAATHLVLCAVVLLATAGYSIPARAADLRFNAVSCQPGTLDCDDGNPCTTDTCDPIAGCQHVAAANGTSCSDGNVCNGMETCQAGTCTSGIPLDCDDSNPCTTDTCDPVAACQHAALANGTSCSDGNVCNGAETCQSGACAGGTPNDCNDGNACTTDTCNAPTGCIHTPIAGCTPCTVDTDCNDNNPCTEDACVAGVCSHTPIAGCPEVCGNCIDDDGNGLVDAEDPACCATPMTLTVSRLTLRSTAARARGNRLQLRTQYAPTPPRTFDPLKQDTTIQLSDAGGALLCATIGAEHWRRTRRLGFRFTDRAHAFAGGLESGEFRVTRNGNLLFTAQGRGLDLRAIEGNSLRLTVRVGEECSQSTMALRPARRGLVFP